ncbi:unnamed protein product, partial [Ectocarpus sp. 4 AP-2014]
MLRTRTITWPRTPMHSIHVSAYDPLGGDAVDGHHHNAVSKYGDTATRYLGMPTRTTSPVRCSTPASVGYFLYGEKDFSDSRIHPHARFPPQSRLLRRNSPPPLAFGRSSGAW